MNKGKVASEEKKIMILEKKKGYVDGVQAKEDEIRTGKIKKLQTPENIKEIHKEDGSWQTKSLNTSNYAWWKGYESGYKKRGEEMTSEEKEFAEAPNEESRLLIAIDILKKAKEKYSTLAGRLPRFQGGFLSSDRHVSDEEHNLWEEVRRIFEMEFEGVSAVGTDSGLLKNYKEGLIIVQGEEDISGDPYEPFWSPTYKFVESGEALELLGKTKEELLKRISDIDEVQNVIVKERRSSGFTMEMLEKRTAEIKKRREGGKEAGFTWQEIDVLLEKNKIKSGTPEADKFMAEWDKKVALEELAKESK